MRSLLAALLLAVLVQIGIVDASATSLHEKIARPKVTFSAQNTSAHLDDTRHLECQLEISRQHDTLNTLRDRALSVANTFGRDLYLLNKNTLKSCTQLHLDMTNSDTRSYRTQLSDWAPILFNSPIERFISDGAVFLNGLEPLKHKAVELANLNQHNISRSVVTLKKSCQGTSEPCIGDDAFMSSDLELKACEKIEPLEHVELAATAWLDVPSKIEEIKKLFSSTWDLVNNAHAQEQKATEEWAATVVAGWIVMLENQVVRTKKKGNGGQTSTIRQMYLSIVLPTLACGSLVVLRPEVARGEIRRSQNSQRRMDG
jgi:hypothetical protein